MPKLSLTGLNLSMDGGGVWLPTDIGGCKLWLREDAVYDELNRESQITDKSGEGNHFTQTTDAKKFVYTANQLDGFPSHRGDVIDDFMSCDSLAALFSGSDKPLYAVIVGKVRTEPGTFGHALLTLGNAASATPLFFVLRAYDNPNDNFLVQRRDDAGNIVSLTSSALTINTFKYWEAIFTGTSMSILENENSLLTDTACDVGITTLDQFTIGMCRYGGNLTQPSDSDFVEVLVYDNIPSTSDKILLRNYVNNRYPSI